MKSSEFRVALMLGGNQGDTEHYFREGIRLLSEHAGKIEIKSRVYISEPWGRQDQPEFMNQAIVLKTSLSARDILTQTKRIETLLGRVRRDLNGPREIDIDILLIGDLVYEDDHLIIPHPRLHLRNFNLIPLAEIAPDWIHPVLNRSIMELMKNCEDSLQIYTKSE